MSSVRLLSTLRADTMDRLGGLPMSERTTALLVEALKLSEEERADLAYALLDTLDSESLNIDSMTEEEFIAELERRREEAMRDPSVLIPWEEVKRMTRIE
jgi:putative addiction module component (TIGR02574 family)